MGTVSKNSWTKHVRTLVKMSGSGANSIGIAREMYSLLEKGHRNGLPRPKGELWLNNPDAVDRDFRRIVSDGNKAEIEENVVIGDDKYGYFVVDFKDDIDMLLYKTYIKKQEQKAYTLMDRLDAMEEKRKRWESDNKQ